MPIYEYRCNTCGAVFEKIMRWSEADRAPACPNCLGTDTHKKVTTFASLGGTSGGGSYSTASSSCGSSGHFS
ncbi:MAG TPA: zinc ribbon domain-containing protein [Anaerolineaceae bacterium]